MGGGLALHGLTRDVWPAGFEHLATEIDDFVDGCLADEGEAGDVTTRRRALLNYRARLHRRILQLDSALEMRGLIDGKGNVRLRWLQRLEGLISTARALDAQLGLERREKRVPSLADVLNGPADPCAQEGGETDGRDDDRD